MEVQLVFQVRFKVWEDLLFMAKLGVSLKFMKPVRFKLWEDQLLDIVHH